MVPRNPIVASSRGDKPAPSKMAYATRRLVLDGLFLDARWIAPPKIRTRRGVPL